MPISNKDKLRLKIAAKRIEANKIKAMTPWTPKPSVGGTIYCFGQDKPEVSYDGKDTVESAPNKVRTSADKIAAQLRLDSGERYTGRDSEYDHPSKLLCGDGKEYKPREYKARADSPFKRAKASASAVVVVRK